jgi:precorrin-6Y C5,15-methyltransferase (decarboxylating)
MSLTERTEPQRAAKRRWLSIVGIGEDGIEGLNTLGSDLIRSAEIVFGGSRHLALAAPLIRGTSRPWASPFDRSVAEILANRGRDVCVLASGDPFLHGVGSLLSAHVSSDEALTVPAPSAFSLAAARLLWPLPQTVLLSLCGRSTDLIRPHLHPGTRILALTSDEQAPSAVADLLRRIGFGRSRLTVLESLAGPRERIRTARADSFALDAIDPLNTVAIEVEAEVGARILPRSAGLDDEWFEHDGQLTKREIRALTLSALAPRRGEHLWDIGAGSGSVVIEWLLADPSLTAIAIERRADRAARVRRNAGTFGVPHLQLVEGAAPEALEGLRTPDAVFIGGGASQPGVLDAVRLSLRSSGRLVVNAVSLQTEAVLLNYQSRWGGSLTRISIARASPIGVAQAQMTGWRPHMPIMQWTWVKP